MNTKEQLKATTKQGGFSLVEMIVVLVVVGFLAMLATRAISGMNGAMRVSNAVSQVQQVQRAVNDSAPRSGIYTGVNITDLIDDGHLTPPNDEAGNPVPASEMNPWEGAISVNSAVSTQYTITFTGITEPDEAGQLAEKLRQIGDVTESDSEVAVTIGG